VIRMLFESRVCDPVSDSSWWCDQKAITSAFTFLDKPFRCGVISKRPVCCFLLSTSRRIWSCSSCEILALHHQGAAQGSNSVWQKLFLISKNLIGFFVCSFSLAEKQEPVVFFRNGSAFVIVFLPLFCFTF